MAKSKIETPPEVLQWLRNIGQLGGFRTAQARTAEERSEAARKAGLEGGRPRKGGTHRWGEKKAS